MIVLLLIGTFSMVSLLALTAALLVSRLVTRKISGIAITVWRTFLITLLSLVLGVGFAFLASFPLEFLTERWLGSLSDNKVFVVGIVLILFFTLLFFAALLRFSSKIPWRAGLTAAFLMVLILAPPLFIPAAEETLDTLSIKTCELIGGSFQSVNATPYSKNRFCVLYAGRSLPRAFASSFIVMSDLYGKDNEYVYLRSAIFPEADPASFETLGGDYARDKNHVYYQNIIYKSILPNDIRILSVRKDRIYSPAGQGQPAVNLLVPFSYAATPATVLHNGLPIDGADPETFLVLPGGWSKDAYHVYAFGKPIENVDVETFEVLSGYHGIVRDKSGIKNEFERSDAVPFQYGFKFGERFFYYDKYSDNKAKANGVELLSLNYLKDSKDAYYQEQKISGADVATFEAYGQCARDKNGYYWEAERISLEQAQQKCLE